MPLFEFECVFCSNKVEILQKSRDSSPDCSCGAGQMKKLISRTSFALKGDGWFRDGYTKRPTKSK